MGATQPNATRGPWQDDTEDAANLEHRRTYGADEDNILERGPPAPADQLCETRRDGDDKMASVHVATSRKNRQQAALPTGVWALGGSMSSDRQDNKTCKANWRLRHGATRRKDSRIQEQGDLSTGVWASDRQTTPKGSSIRASPSNVFGEEPDEHVLKAWSGARGRHCKSSCNKGGEQPVRRRRDWHRRTRAAASFSTAVGGAQEDSVYLSFAGELASKPGPSKAVAMPLVNGGIHERRQQLQG